MADLMVCLSFDLDNASATIARNQMSPSAISRGDFGIVAVPRILRLLAERLQFFLGPAAARAHNAQARERERRGHDFDKMPPRHRVGELARALGKLAFQPLLEIRRVAQFIQAAPVTAATQGRRGGRWRIGFHSRRKNS